MAPRPSEAAVQPCRTTCADSQWIVWVQRGRVLRLTRVRGVPFTSEALCFIESGRSELVCS